VLKLSGEALQERGSRENISRQSCARSLIESKSVHSLGVQISIVIAGEIFGVGPPRAVPRHGFERRRITWHAGDSDQCARIAEHATKIGVEARVQTARVPRNVNEQIVWAEPLYTWSRALDRFDLATSVRRVFATGPLGHA